MNMQPNRPECSQSLSEPLSDFFARRSIEEAVAAHRTAARAAMHHQALSLLYAKLAQHPW